MILQGTPRIPTMGPRIVSVIWLKFLMTSGRTPSVVDEVDAMSAYVEPEPKRNTVTASQAKHSLKDGFLMICTSGGYEESGSV